MNTQLPPSSPFPLTENLWKDNENIIWLGSSLSLKRNIEKIPFPGKLTLDKKHQIRGLLLQAALEKATLAGQTPLLAENTSPIDREFITEHFLLRSSLHHILGGEAFLLSQNSHSALLINFEDHLQLTCLDTSEELSKGWEKLLKLELEIAKSVGFAFSPKFGYLTADPATCGTALVITLFLHLPAILAKHKLDELTLRNKDAGIIHTGLQGNPNELIGDIVALRNRYTFGVTEEHILSTLQTAATKLTAEEKTVRSKLKKGAESEVAEIKDRVSRAFAILRHSYQIEAVEALNAISLMKMGLDLGWLKGVSQSTLNHLFFALRHAHLLCHFEQKPTPEELPHRRAEFIHKELQTLELLI